MRFSEIISLGFVNTNQGRLILDHQEYKGTLKKMGTLKIIRKASCEKERNPTPSLQLTRKYNANLQLHNKDPTFFLAISMTNTFPYN